LQSTGNLTATIEGDMDSARSFVSNTTTKGKCLCDYYECWCNVRIIALLCV